MQAVPCGLPVAREATPMMFRPQDRAVMSAPYKHGRGFTTYTQPPRRSWWRRLLFWRRHA